MGPPVVVYDACVLYPAPLRDLLMHLAWARLVRARWTEAIHDEWIRNLLADRPDLSRAQLERTRALMERAVPEASVTGYERRIPTLSLPDPDDRHVLAAALEAGAAAIVTFNLVDFPRATLEPHGVEAVHPDAFVAGLFDAGPEGVIAAVRTQRVQLRNPPVRIEELLETLHRQGLVETVARLRAAADRL
jgi:predicted nucleic acid-binding protein